jgi:4'-phosphopantetheinyl transferase
MTGSSSPRQASAGSVLPWSGDKPCRAISPDIGQTLEILWPPPHVKQPALGPNEVHVWCACLDNLSAEMSAFWKMLTEAERARAQRFRFQVDHDRLIIRRGLLRVILGWYLPDAPGSIEFQESASGKPEVTSQGGAGTLHFNMSHSDQLALYAISRAAPVGVDVERIRPVSEFQDIGARFFHPRETANLQALPEADRLDAFYHCWTRKEAVLKATGQGIGNELAEIEVEFVPGEVVRVLSIRDEAHAAAGWSLHALQPARGFAAALACCFEDLKLCPWRLKTSASSWAEEPSSCLAAASTSQIGRFETEVLTQPGNLKALTKPSGKWIDRLRERQPMRELILDMDSLVSDTYGGQEGTAYNGQLGCTCYHPLPVEGSVH